MDPGLLVSNFLLLLAFNLLLLLLNHLYIVRISCSIVFFLCVQFAHAQFKLRGAVYDSSRTYPVEAVSVLSTSGRGTVTDAKGHYELMVNETDSIWFSYLNKPTIKFPVAKILDPTQFDLALQINMRMLKEITIRPKSYRLDSLQNRLDYEKVFNYKKPSLATMTNIGANGAGIDINELICAFQFRRNKSILKFQQRLLLQEQDKFIDHRFNKLLARRLTHFDSSNLDRFMVLYRPVYEFTLYASDFEFQTYIKKMAENFRHAKKLSEIKKENGE